MKKRNNKHEKRVKRLIVACGLCAIILSVSTYAWFIGMKTVNVSSFDVEVAAIDSLSLSLNGKDWADSVSISKENFKDAYTNNTNTWTERGLIPMSSIGEMDEENSRLVLYEKASLTATAGGYRLLSSRADNTGAAEADGYIAFDLFIRNLSGKEYYSENNALNEEAVYLTPQSAVKVASTADKADNSGIENSVRIGFAQIGRVIATTEDETVIQGITCETKDAITGICREAQIWEPNDTKHVDNAIKWYDKSCKLRTAKELTEAASYSGKCGTVEDGKYAPTYAITSKVDVADKIDVYDGEEYNGYKDSTKLKKMNYFTDTMKDLKGTERPELLTLAPNSITKVRVYIWLEGQDIDNYDFASLGKKISVAFGFTKEQLYGEDIGYEGEPQLPADVATRTPAPTVTP